MTLHIPDIWKKELRRLWWLLLLPAALILKEIAARNPLLVEQYFANGIFPVVSTAIGWIFGVFPFSFAEFLIYTLIVLLAGWIIGTIVKAKRRTLKPIRLFRTIVSFAIAACAVIFSFYFLWGFNYYRPSIAYSMQLEVKEREPQQLADLCVVLANTASTLREEVEADEDGVFMLPGDIQTILNEIPQAYINLGEQYPQFSRILPPPKAVAASELMSYAGIAGIFIPFTEEANVNVHQNALLLPSAAAHESAHLMGIAREDEANFLAYLACIHSDNKSIAYSGVMLALVHVGNALYDISPEAYAQARGYYSDDVKRDLAAHNEYWDAYEGQAEEAVTKMNDNYLKQHQQSDGVMSYGRMADLLLAYYSDLLESLR